METMPKFISAYSPKMKNDTPTGEMIEPEFGYEINKKGQKVLVQTGEKNVYEKIQAELEDSKIENIIARVTAGDTSMLRPDGIYEDTTEAPKNLIEARRMMQELENTWNTLPMTIKNKYDNDVETFIGASGTEGWLKDMGLLPTEAPTPVQEIVKEVAKESAKEVPVNES